MAKKIIWSNRSLKAISEILDYWYHRNGNKKHSSNLERQFRLDAKRIARLPFIGRTIEGKQTLFLVSGPYKIIYRINKEIIEIITVWDSRRNPDDLINID